MTNLLKLLKRVFRKLKKILEKATKKSKYEFEYLTIFRTLISHRKQERIVRKKNLVTVAFFVIHASVWKYDYLYKLFACDKGYNPIIVICPYTPYGDDVMLREMKLAYKEFLERGYNVINSYNNKNNTWIDIKEYVKPDIVFFTNPHPLTKRAYQITNFIDTLTCYSPYSFHITHLHEIQYDQLFHNVLWKAFYETSTHKMFSKQYSRIKGKNVFVTGYPGNDIFLDKRYSPKNPWKNPGKKLKKIIWAPHHSIDDKKKFLSFSTFLKFHDVFLVIAEEYKGILQFAFKPHPILKAKLSQNEVWGREKTEEYYNKWNEIENGQIEEGLYEDLFLTSDALIFDSASFMTEYLMTIKPSLFLLNDKNVSERFNSFGKKIFSVLYHGKGQIDIKMFIEEVVLNENDTMLNDRKKFINKELSFDDDLNASTMIKNYLDSII